MGSHPVLYRPPPSLHTSSNHSNHHIRGSSFLVAPLQITPHKMKLLLPSLLLLGCGLILVMGAPPQYLDAEEAHNPNYRALANYVQQKRAMDREMLAEYLASLGTPDYNESEVEERAKRWWGGNKYRDNKSYGFWITALNKAGNVKRGKRAAPFVPAMSALEDDHNPLTGSSDYSSVSELVPDKISEEQ